MKRTPSVLGFSAQNEDIYTVINGQDKEDYIVDIVNNKKVWIPYISKSDDEEIIEYIYFNNEVEKPKSKISKYRSKLAEFVEEIEASTPNIKKSIRLKQAQEMYRQWKIKNP
jgi:glutaredoxin-related protein